MEKLNVAILFGGCSPEYGVSLESAHAVITHLDSTKYNPVLIGISHNGNWYYYTGEPEKIRLDTWNNPDDCAPALVSPNRDSRALLVLEDAGVQKIPLDAAFPVLHGRNGEDGTVQGLFELAGIPLAGCGVLASAVCMDKDRAHRLASTAGVAVPASVVLERDDVNTAAAAAKIGYPLFVKPMRAGSSYGISKVSGPGGLSGALELAFAYDSRVILEESVSGFEVGCAVLGNRSLSVGELDEIELSGGFFDFTEKYTLKTSAIHVPARILPEKAREMKETAKRIYRALGCQGFARVDMFLDNNGKIFFNEVNTVPGFTAHSRYPSMMKAAGMSFEQVLSAVIELAVNR
ncbi:MAG: D-alanine--D-serine ligase VanG [Oscillospiraceae bacterium]|nr:D-alanine--D-serine ligase VanG [Oscillospiraceae bacterium]